MPGQVAYVWMVRWKPEAGQRRKAPRVPSDQSFDIFGQECDEQKAFGFEIRGTLHRVLLPPQTAKPNGQEGQTKRYSAGKSARQPLTITVLLVLNVGLKSVWICNVGIP